DAPPLRRTRGAHPSHPDLLEPARALLPSVGRYRIEVSSRPVSRLQARDGVARTARRKVPRRIETVASPAACRSFARNGRRRYFCGARFLWGFAAAKIAEDNCETRGSI